MQLESSVSALAHTIQLSVAPVFLLTGVGSFLNVLANRLARIIDRTRVLEGTKPAAPDVHAAVQEELRVLHRRTELINRAIGMCTYCALLVAGVVAALFVGVVLDVGAVRGLRYGHFVALGFVAAMITLIFGLTSFLGEVHLATRHMREQAQKAGMGARA